MPASQDCGAPKGISGPDHTIHDLYVTSESRGAHNHQSFRDTCNYVRGFITQRLPGRPVVGGKPAEASETGEERKKRSHYSSPPPLHHLSTTSPPLLLPLLLQPSACSCCCPPSDHCLPHIPSPRLVGRSPSFATRPLAVSTSRVVVSVVVAPPTPFSQPRKDFLPPAEGSQPSTPSSDSPNRPLHELSTSPLDDRDRQRPRLAAWPTANAAGLTCPSTSPT
jgi:hypothetical protein